VLRSGLAVVALGEPGKDDGDAAADGFAGGELGALAEEDRRCLPGGPPMGEVRALHVDGGLGGWHGHAGEDQPGGYLLEAEATGYRELALQLRNLHVNALPCALPSLCESNGMANRSNIEVWLRLV